MHITSKCYYVPFYDGWDIETGGSKVRGGLQLPDNESCRKLFGRC
jgi:hypothetical protein